MNAISTVERIMSAAPRLRGGSPSDCTSAHAIGTMMAVRPVIDGMPSARMNPIRKKPDRSPPYVAGNSDRM
jgi:hypothetical protein